ncbi:hypothetical protein [Flavobacterium limnophilum]|uniref:hypothetical protein n=1 Tax=Flavobacterium limnophilum TaxID=3003262 RepID=UPI0022AC8529|nr:hypothetical protein [Flavobacterium limnophilum]
MKTLKYITTAIEFLKSLNIRTKANTANETNTETTNTRFGINLKKTSGKAPTSLLGLMYSEENNTLFI